MSRLYGNRYTTENPRRRLTPGARVTDDEFKAIRAAADKRHLSVGQLLRAGLVAIGVLKPDAPPSRD